MKIERRPVKWEAEHLMCDCGDGNNEMDFVFSVRKPEGLVYLHTCGKCGKAEETKKQYPSPVWSRGDEVK